MSAKDGGDQNGSDQPAPSLQELKASVVSDSVVAEQRQRKYEREFAKKSFESERNYAHIRGLSDHYRHRDHWSWALIWAMAFMIGFQSLLLTLVGFGVWDFSKYKWLIPALLVQNLAQIAGLAVLVVKSVFKEMKF